MENFPCIAAGGLATRLRNKEKAIEALDEPCVLWNWVDGEVGKLVAVRLYIVELGSVMAAPARKEPRSYSLVMIRIVLYEYIGDTLL